MIAQPSAIRFDMNDTCTLCTLGDAPGCEACLGVDGEPVGEPKQTILYRIRHVPSGRIYLGVHRIDGNPFDDDGYLGSSEYLDRAIDKHGREQFEKHVLVVLPTEEAAYELEAAWVGPQQVRSRRYFNLMEGGRGGFAHLSEEAKARGRIASADACRELAKDPAWQEKVEAAKRRPDARAKARTRQRAYLSSLTPDEHASAQEKRLAGSRTLKAQAKSSASQRAYIASLSSAQRDARTVGLRKANERRRAEAQRRKREVALIFLALIAAKYGDQEHAA